MNSETEQEREENDTENASGVAVQDRRRLASNIALTDLSLAVYHEAARAPVASCTSRASLLSVCRRCANNKAAPRVKGRGREVEAEGEQACRHEEAGE